MTFGMMFAKREQSRGARVKRYNPNDEKRRERVKQVTDEWLKNKNSKR